VCLLIACQLGASRVSTFVRFFKQRRYPVEFLLLVLLMFAVPSFEAPKNLLVAAYVITWLINRYAKRDFGGPWDGWDTIIAAWLVSGYLTAIFASLHGSEWGGANDMLRYISLLWAIKRSRYGREFLMLLPVLAAVGTLPPLIYGLWQFFVTHQKAALELNSVGHVNHSAIYLAIACGAMFAAVAAWWTRLPIVWRCVGTSLTLLLGTSVLISASRGATGALFIFTLILSAAWLRRSRMLGIALLTVTLSLGCTAYLLKPAVVIKQEQNAQNNNTLSYRDSIWNAALVAWHHAPLLGIGINNYHQIDQNKIKAWREQDQLPFVAGDYFMAPHAHSLFLNTLAERGIIGITTLLAVLGYWLYSQFRYLPNRTASSAEWALWGGALSALVISVVVGLVNTTLHHEHAMLSVVLLGSWLAYRRTSLE